MSKFPRLAGNNNTPLQQETPPYNDNQVILKTISHYAENGFDEICITHETFTYCAIEQKKWKIWTNLPIKESTMKRHEMAVNLGYDLPPLPEKLIKSEEIMGNFTSYHNRCANTIIIENDQASNQMCSDSDQIFFDKLTKLILVNDTEFLITISPVYIMPPSTASNDFGLDYFVQSQNRLKHLIDTASTLDGFISK